MREETSKGVKRVVGKKRYVELRYWKDGHYLNHLPIDKRIHITGFEAIRSDANPIVVTIQKDIFKLVLTRRTNDEIIKTIYTYIQALKQGKLDDLLGKPVHYGKLKIAQRSAEYSNKYMGLDIKKGQPMKYYYIEKIIPEPGQFLPETDVIALYPDQPIPQNVVLDYKKYIEKVIFNTTMKTILNVLGIQRKECETLQKQTNLEEWE